MLFCRIWSLGPLRLGLLALAIGIAIAAPEPQVKTIFEWPLIIPTLVIPAIAPLMLMVLLLDLMMAAIFAADSQAPERKRRYRRIMLIHLAVSALLVWRWLPFFMALGG